MWRAGAGGTRKKRRTAKDLGGVFPPIAVMSALWIGERSRAQGQDREKVKHERCPWQFLIEWA